MHQLLYAVAKAAIGLLWRVFLYLKKKLFKYADTPSLTLNMIQYKA